MGRRRIAIGLAGLLVLAGALYGALRLSLIADSYNPLAPIDLAAAPNLMTEPKLWIMSGDTPACIAALARAGVRFELLPKRPSRRGCERDGTVLLSRLWKAGLAAEEMRCDIALRLYLLERHAIQPLALRHLGAAVDRIEHFGSYSCRTIAGSSRMSEHATANAIDISGFRLDGGRTVSLKRGWTAGGKSARFLRDVRAGACRWFNMVLSPDYNEAHADHFHADMGWFRGCH